MRKAKTNQKVGESALLEAEAQVAIIKILKNRDYKSRRRIMTAVDMLCEANELVPGILEAVARTK